MHKLHIDFSMEAHGVQVVDSTFGASHTLMFVRVSVEPDESHGKSLEEAKYNIDHNRASGILI